jgi:hypothetical protein
MDQPSIFIGSLPGEDVVKLLVDGRTVAVFVPEEIEHPKTGEILEHRWGNADRLLMTLVNGKGGWTLSEDPQSNGASGISFWLTPRETNVEPPIRITMRVDESL